MDKNKTRPKERRKKGREGESEKKKEERPCTQIIGIKGKRRTETLTSFTEK